MDLSVFKLLRSFLLVLFIAVIEYQRGSFTRSAAVTGFVLCFIIAYTNIVFLFVMVTFVLSGTFATRYKSDVKQKKILENDHSTTKRYKKTARDHYQVLCNSLVGSVFALGYCWHTNFSGRSWPIDNKGDASVYSIGYLLSVACCCGDTLASELGSVWSQDQPRLITNPFRTVPVGTNGGVSRAGCFFSLVGGLISGLSYVIGNAIFCHSDHLIDISWINVQLVVYCALFGLVGSLIDSVLGATLQFSGYDRERNMTVQRPGPSIERIAGRDILSNNMVNLFSSLLTSLLGVFLLPKILY